MLPRNFSVSLEITQDLQIFGRNSPRSQVVEYWRNVVIPKHRIDIDQLPGDFTGFPTGRK